MKKLFLLFFLLALPGFAQTFAGRAGSDIFITPPFRFCLGSDDGAGNCALQTGSQLIRWSGALDFQIPAKTVASLPVATSNLGRLYRVTDGQNSTDCTSGGGTTTSLCFSNGTSWLTIGSGAGSTVFGTPNQINVISNTVSLANPTTFPGGALFNGAVSINSGIGAVGLIPDPLCAFSFGLGSQDQLCNLNGQLVWNYGGVTGTNYLIPWMKYYDLIGSPPANGSLIFFNSVTGQFELFSGNTSGTKALVEDAAGNRSWGTTGTTVTLQTNGVNNASQTTLNIINSTANAVGLTVTCANPAGGNEQCEVAGTNYTGNAATASSAVQLNGVETTAPSGTAGSDKQWPDSTAHRWKMNNNNAGAVNIVGIGSAGGSGNCVQFAANGIDLSDAGGGCLTQTGTIYAKSFGVKADTRIVKDVTTTSGTKTITCPNNDCNFVSGDVGKLVWVQSTISSGADVLVQDVIATVNTAQSITVTTNNASSSHTANAVLVWGTDDSAALDTAYAATGPANCAELLLPSGLMLTQRPQFNYAVAGCPLTDTFQVPTVSGVSSTATIVIPTPNFNVAAGHGCSGGGVTACFFGVQYELVFFLKINGLGNTISSPGTITLWENNSALTFDIILTSWCASCTTVTGMATVGPEAENVFGGVLGSGQVACTFNGIGEVEDNFFCNSPTAAHIFGGSLMSRGDNWGGTVIVDAGAIMTSYDDYESGTTSLQVAGTANLFSFHKSTSTPPLQTTASGAKINLQNTALPSSTSTAYNGLSYAGFNGSTFFDVGGNTFSGQAAASYPIVKQAAENNVASGTSVSKAWPTNPAANAVEIVACDDFPSTSTINTPTDTRGLTWTQIGTNLTTTTTFGSALNSAVWYAKDVAGGADTVTCNFSAAVTTGVINIIEIDGANITTPLDGSTTSSGSGTSIASSAQNTTQNTDLGFLLAFRNTSPTFTPGACTPTGCTSISGLLFMGGDYQQTPTASAQSMPATWSVNADWTAFWFNVKPYAAFPPMSGNAFMLNCAAVGSAANPSVANCGAASVGTISCATNASTGTCTVNTSAVTANSDIFVQQVVSEGTRLGVTCNTGSVLPAGPLLLSKTAGIGFTLTMGTITTNPGCFVYSITN